MEAMGNAIATGMFDRMASCGEKEVCILMLCLDGAGWIYHFNVM